MTIWLPERMYRALPPVCIFLGMVFLVTSPGPASVVLSIALIGYGGVVLASRYVGNGITTAS